MADELIDIIDENDNLTGLQKMKSEAHRDGLWHRAAHIWIYSSKGEILLQFRASEKPFFPDKWDISAAGHIGAGEEPIVSGLRELEEELGIKAGPQDLDFFGTRKASAVYNDIINKEYYYVYFMKFDGDISSLSLQKEEVGEVRFFLPEDLLLRLDREPEKFVPHGSYWNDALNEIRKRTAADEKPKQ